MVLYILYRFWGHSCCVGWSKMWKNRCPKNMNMWLCATSQRDKDTYMMISCLRLSKLEKILLYFRFIFLIYLGRKVHKYWISLVWFWSYYLIPGFQNKRNTCHWTFHECNQYLDAIEESLQPSKSFWSKTNCIAIQNRWHQLLRSITGAELLELWSFQGKSW